MAIHYTNELIFDLPEQFLDKTNHIFSLTHESPSEFNIVINHNPIDKNESLQSYGERMVHELKKALPQFKLLITNYDITIVKHPALKLCYSWTQEGRVLHQTQISFFYDDESGEPHVMQIAGTALNNLSDKWEAVFTKILNSMKLRQASN